MRHSEGRKTHIPRKRADIGKLWDKANSVEIIVSKEDSKPLEDTVLEPAKVDILPSPLLNTWHLAITEEDFDTIYFGLGMDKDIFKRVPETDIDYQDNFAVSKLWRMNNWYKVIDKNGDLVWFVMNRAQHVAHADQLRHARVAILKSRQRGISTFYTIKYFDDAICYDNIEVGMQSYGLIESAKLLKKLEIVWRELSDSNKALLEIGLAKSNTRAMGFTNGSQIQVATSFRGDTLHRLHVSELGKIASKDPKKAEEIYTGTLQAIKAGNDVAIESTAEGQHNLFHTKWYLAADHVGVRGLKDFRPVFLSWVDDPDCNSSVEVEIDEENLVCLEKVEGEWSEYAGFIQWNSSMGEYDPAIHFRLTNEQKWWFVSAYRELGEKFHQEYPHTPESAFEAVRDGTYYAKLWRSSGHVWDKAKGEKAGRERLYNPELVVHTAWDLGRNDMMVIVFYQVVGGDLAIIDEYHNTGEDLEHYVNMLVSKRSKLGYVYGKHILPHDAKVTDLSSDISRKNVLVRLGLRGIRVLRRTKDVNNDIEQVRQAIKSMWIDPITAKYILLMMSRYTKEWDDVRGTWKDKPKHDEWSNPADAVRYMVMSGMHDKATGYENSGGNYTRSNIVGGIRSNIVDGLAL